MKHRYLKGRIKRQVCNRTAMRCAVCAFSLLVLLAGCGKTSRAGDSRTENEPQETLPAYVLKEVTYYHYRDGYLQVEIAFETGEYYAEADELRIDNCTFLYYDINENLLSRGRSNSATIHADRSLIIAEDEVVIISELNGGVLETDHLEWHGNKEQFLTESYVSLTRKNIDSITGTGMVADIALRTVTIKKNVRGILGSTGG
jgi:LPS export ABC transporter protein LptC